jgi:hypothetical protein
MSHLDWADEQDNTNMLREEYLQLPACMDKQSIADYLEDVNRSRPTYLPTAARAIRDRWACAFGKLAEHGRLMYLETVLRQLKVSDEILTLTLGMNDKWRVQELDKQNRQAETSAGIPALQAQAKAEKLRVEIDRAKTDQAKAIKERETLNQPVAPQPTKEDRRQQEIKTIEENIQLLTARRTQVAKEHLSGRSFEELSPSEQEEYQADENSYTHRIRRLKERRIELEGK